MNRLSQFKKVSHHTHGFTLFETVIVLAITALVLLATVSHLHWQERKLLLTKTVQSVALNYEQYQQRAQLNGENITIQAFNNRVIFQSLTQANSTETITLPKDIQVLQARTLFLRRNYGLEQPTKLTFYSGKERLSIVFQLGGGEYVIR